MLKGCAREKWTLTYHRPDDFTVCCWQRTPGVSLKWIMFRFAAALYFHVGLLLMLIYPIEEGKWYKDLIFFAFWCYCLEVACFTLALVIVILKYVEQKKNPETPLMEKMPRHYQVLWVLNNITSPASVVILVVFWLIVYDPDTHQNLLNYLTCQTFSCVIILLDFSFNAYPYQIVHFYMPSSCFTIYTFFGAIYQLCGGRGIGGQIPIYKILDWRYPVQALAIGALMVGSIAFIHCVFSVVSTLKNWMRKMPEEQK